MYVFVSLCWEEWIEAVLLSFKKTVNYLLVNIKMTISIRRMHCMMLGCFSCIFSGKTLKSKTDIQRWLLPHFVKFRTEIWNVYWIYFSSTSDYSYSRHTHCSSRQAHLWPGFGRKFSCHGPLVGLAGSGCAS